MTHHKDMIAYFNCSSGISGDMLLGALVDAGVPLEELKKRLLLLPVRGYELKKRKVKRAGILATKVDVIIKPEVKSQKSKVGAYGHTPTARKWDDIEKIINKSTLPNEIKQKGLSIFKRLFEAEAKVHGRKMQDIHLHELGAVDCIIDIFGTLTGLDILGIDTVYSSPVNVGSGTVKTEHGLLPVPAPATVQLLKGVPVYSNDILFELTTPTGAVLISSLARRFRNIPEMKILNTGTGAGDKDFKAQPNVLTMIVGEQSAVSGRGVSQYARTIAEEIIIVETNIDDMNPQVYEYVIEKLFKEGALDVFLTQIIMKKGRPGTKLSVLCNEDKMESLIDVIMNETTSIGVRFYKAERKVLRRESKSVKTKYGMVDIKISYLSDKRQKRSLEYEDCRKIAEKHNIPLLEIMNTLKR